MRISIRIGESGKRMLVTHSNGDLVVRMIVATSTARGDVSGHITSTRFPLSMLPTAAAMSVLIKQGTDEMEAAYTKLETAHRSWKNGRPGMRPRSPAGRSQMVKEAAVITAIGLSFGAAYRELLAIDASAAPDTVPDWLDSALEDLERGHSPLKAAENLVTLLIRPDVPANAQAMAPKQ